MTWADEARSLAEADVATKRAFVAWAVHVDTERLTDSYIEEARRKIAAGYQFGTIALDLEDAKPRYTPITG